LLLIGFILSVIAKGETVAALLSNFTSWVEALGWIGPIVFMLGYAGAVVAFAPGSLLTAAAGAIFGIGEGTLYVFVGASVGACMAFLIARHLARSLVEQRLSAYPKFEAVDRAIGRQGLKIVLLLRLSPVFPFNALNYLLGLTQVSLRDFAIACLGMIPGTVLYVYLGRVAREVATLGGEHAHKSPAEIGFLSLGFLATAFVTIILARTAKRALEDSTNAP